MSADLNSTVIADPLIDPTSSSMNQDAFELFKMGVYQSFIMIFLAEIGDKTFFLVTLLSNKMNRFLLFIFASLAMNIMNALSVCIGAIFPLFMPKIAISILVIVLFLGFGLRLLYGAACHTEDGEDAKEEA